MAILDGHRVTETPTDLTASIRNNGLCQAQNVGSNTVFWIVSETSSPGGSVLWFRLQPGQTFDFWTNATRVWVMTAQSSRRSSLAVRKV